MRYDLEGIAADLSIERPQKDAGFWLASEGDASTTKNMLIQVNSHGAGAARDLPARGGCAGRPDRQQRLRRRGGVEKRTVSARGRAAAVQRRLSRERRRCHTRIARYDLKNETWDAFFYPLENGPGTIGLSEISLVGVTHGGDDVYAVIERDNRLAGSANLKRVYTFTLNGLQAVDVATPVNAAAIAGTAVTKSLFRTSCRSSHRTRR